MNKSKLKAYAPQARQDFIKMIRQRADLLGLTKREITPARVEGDVAVIEGNAYPKRFGKMHTDLTKRIKTEGIEQLIGRVAYSWFNRFAAPRFMEVNDFLAHGFRVLSNRDANKSEPEILTHAAEIELPGLDKEKIVELKLNLNNEKDVDAKLYKMLIVAQCNELNRAMPFLFEKIGDETEILLPDNLLATDSVIRKMVAAIDETDWSEVEIIGWLYQFYISEKKDEVIGKTVKSEDIPAATQLFTPNWIVKYMTQNSLGRLWLEANPHSSLETQMEFYIEGEREKGKGISKEGENENDSSEFQGLDRLAKGDGFGSDGLSVNEGVSERGTLRPNESSSSSGGFDSIKHRGGTCTDIAGGISQFSLDSERIAGGSPDSIDDCATSELYDESTTKSGSDITDGNPQNAQQINKKTDSRSLIPNPFPLSPEDIKILDPACGSGHILVEAYELLKAIYTERGYGSRDIPLLILKKNLFGLDIDERAAQMASFALLMKARRDDRRIFEKLNKTVRESHEETRNKTENDFSEFRAFRGEIPNIITIPDSSHLKAEEIAELFFSGKDRSNAVIPIRDDKYLFGEMETQPSLIMQGNREQGVGDSEEKSKNYSLNPNSSSLDEVSETNVVELLELFAQGKTLGSLVRIPHGFERKTVRETHENTRNKTENDFSEFSEIRGQSSSGESVLERIAHAVEIKRASGNFYEQIAAREIEPFVRAAKMLAQKYDCVIANPPYMGGKGMNADLKDFAKKNFPDSKSDLFAMFIERGFELLKKDGFNAMVTMQSWMFLSSFEALRERLLDEKTITDLTQIGYNSFPTLNSKIAQAVVFTMKNQHIPQHKGIYVNLNDAPQSANKELVFKQSPKIYEITQNDFKKIPGSPIAYWVSDKVREVFEKGSPLGEIAETRKGMVTADNDSHVRLWFEVSLNKSGFNFTSRENAKESKKKWFPYLKGGGFRKWVGNSDSVVNWEDDGFALQTIKHPKENRILATNFNLEYIFRPNINWGAISSSDFSARISKGCALFDAGGSACFPPLKSIHTILGFLNSIVSKRLLNSLNPTLNFQAGNIADLSLLTTNFDKANEIVEECVAIARADWDSFETSWDFKRFPMLEMMNGEHSQVTDEHLQVNDDDAHVTDAHSHVTVDDLQLTDAHSQLTVGDSQVIVDDLQMTDEDSQVSHADLQSLSVEKAWNNWKRLCDERIARMQELETENNRLFIEAYGLQDELSPEVPLEQITLARAGEEKDVRRLLSYFIGCLMGRYSLDEEGLIYADAGNKGFDSSRYQTFPADDDGIVPVTDMEWFPQEAARQFEQFIAVAFGGIRDKGLGIRKEDSEAFSSLTPNLSSLASNMKWIAEKLGAKAGETSIETIRRYFSTAFFKDHLQTYKKRPIYWLFSSGKQKAFECLVYLHRYNEATLPRMRYVYVLSLMSKLTAQIEHTENDIEKAATTSEKIKNQKLLETLRKKQTELAAFDEKLRHYSDMRIDLDLDDGVKVNYGRFGDLLAEVKQVAKTAE